MNNLVYISIIIVNYHTAEYLINCIRSITLNTQTIHYEIIIVDNSDEKEKFEPLLSENDYISYIKLESNRGFGYACNRGVDISSGEVILFLNPDIIVTKNSIEALYKFITNIEDVGFVTGMLTNDAGETQYFYNYFPDISWELKEAFGLYVGKTINKLNNIKAIKDKTPFLIDWAHGACLMIKSEIFKSIPGFDENIFLYYEDVDIQKQVLDLKYKNYCQPVSQFIHYERSSVRSKEGMRIYYFYMHYSKLYYMKKYHPFWKRTLIRISYILGFSSKIILLVFRKKYAAERMTMLTLYLMVIAVYLNLKKANS